MTYLRYLLNNIDKFKTIKDLTLLRGYHQTFEQYPGLHPDGFDYRESGWPEQLKFVCAEMWRRVERPESGIKLEHMYYINRSFRKLVAESQRQSGQHANSDHNVFQA
jgi:hypothetical protein